MMSMDVEETNTEIVPGEDDGCISVDMKTITVGGLYSVNGMDVAGLRTDTLTTRFYARSNTIVLYSSLESSSLLQGPPGSGKSTFVWNWLLRSVVQKIEPAVWFHFHKYNQEVTCVLVEPHETDNTVRLTEIQDVDPFKFVASKYEVKHCVVDGVRENNLERAAASWKVFGAVLARLHKTKHMIWVSSQQVVIPGEELQFTDTKEITFLSWQREDVDAFAAMFSDAEKEAFKTDAQLVLQRGNFGGETTLNSFEQAVGFKFWLFGGSAKRLFGMGACDAFDGLNRFISKVDDAEKLNSGLQGLRGEFAVNHVVGQYDGGVIQLISEYVLQTIAKRVGLKAICVMYNSPWVRNNPSVHGFVFEWDIFVQLETTKQLNLSDSRGQQVTWLVDEDVSLHQFVTNGVTTSRMMIRPAKWNHPEYDGLYLTHDSEGGNHLVAWNASEAATHKGKVDKLVVLLQQLSMRADQPISFDTVRFIFIIPELALKTFELPSAAETLQARQLVSCANWGFTEFEVLCVKHALVWRGSAQEEKTKLCLFEADSKVGCEFSRAL